MLCELCFMEKTSLGKCPCKETFEDFRLHSFSTATIQVSFETDFFSTYGHGKGELYNLFHVIKQFTEETYPEFNFREGANRRNSSVLSEKAKVGNQKKSKDHMYNSALIRKTYTNGPKTFSTSCLLFKDCLIITLGNYGMREKVFRDYMGIISSIFRRFATFNVTLVKNALVNMSFKGSCGPSSRLKSAASKSKCVRLKSPNFDLKTTYELLKPHFNTETRKIIFNPIVTDTNRIQILLFSDDLVKKKIGTCCIYTSGTCMYLGFKRVATILQEYGLIARVLRENGYTIVEP